jgi:glycosyltransferase involved in cell wall biosynthesis
MRVLLYSHYFAPGSGGLATFSDGLAGSLGSLGVTVRMATASVNTSAVKRPWPIHWAVTARELIRLCRWAEVVHMNGFRAAVVGAAWLTRRPVIWTHHEYSFCPTGLGWWQERDRSFALPQCWACLLDRGYDRRSALRRIAATAARTVSRRLVSAHTTTTEHMKRRLDLASSAVVPLGVTLPVQEAQAKGPKNSEFTVAYAGRLIPEKGVDVAIRAIAEARRHGSDVRLVVIGDGPERGVLEELAQRELPASACTFLGELNPDLALARMALADAVIVPSVWSEPAGFVVLEAMALGVPVIATEAGGIPEVARGAALLAARSEAAAFARAITELASDSKRSRAMVRQGKAIAARYSAGHMATLYVELYDRLLRRPVGDATVGSK